jgi:hypothetical protein
MPRYVYRGPGRIVTFSTKNSFLGKWERGLTIRGTRKNCHKIHNTGLARDGQPSFLIDRRRTIQAVSGVILYMRTTEPGRIVTFSTKIAELGHWERDLTIRGTRKNCHKIHNTGLARDGQPSFLIDRRRTMQAISSLPSTCSKRSQAFLVSSFSTRRISGKTPRSWFQDETTQTTFAGLWGMPRYVYRGSGRIVTKSTTQGWPEMVNLLFWIKLRVESNQLNHRETTRVPPFLFKQPLLPWEAVIHSTP